jgi:hypothetical protein
LSSCNNFRETVEAGGPIGTSPDLAEIARIGATIVAKVIEGTIYIKAQIRPNLMFVATTVHRDASGQMRAWKDKSPLRL